jgi:hypothetical protein
VTRVRTMISPRSIWPRCAATDGSGSAPATVTPFGISERLKNPRSTSPLAY